MEDTLAANPELARLLVDLFAERFDPERGDDAGQRAITSKIEEALEAVSNLDQDRIIRRFLNAIQSTLRTNFFQPGEDGVLPGGIVSVSRRPGPRSARAPAAGRPSSSARRCRSTRPVLSAYAHRPCTGLSEL